MARVRSAGRSWRGPLRAAAIDVHYQTVGYLERGECSPSLALAFRIARYVDLPVEAVFSDRPFAPIMSVVYDRDRRDV